MKIIPVKTPVLIKSLFSEYTWDFSSNAKGGEKKIYLTFDDGPIPKVTEFVLDQLKQYNAKATFFCIGENIEKHPNIFNKIISEKHSIGNHTMNHMKAWKNNTNTYLENISTCEKKIAEHITSQNKLFRPPYGHISKSKLSKLKRKGYHIILWDVISKDWDKNVSPEECLGNVINHSENGSIIVFHDSIKASKNMSYALPRTLDFFTQKGYIFDKI
ncbi:polysaccharide deacetylase family protein [Aquimarina sp. RZ0]|uniref:polysaccharide deacetylase family protein n=1 Tax=Aquimarina sp. RZ0 TaxID=2607730 RepID=UPI0011F2CF56|nr:polysaccharide deacetylase family protein [Aquimarina sp. RZ0]KAA1245109.1 polysaccharide deacetylase family protein [Aquimarina sp. RZ0]